ncbi:hypothetical protein Y695_01555 [Hydrogenophaga sp. T4]|nr:hypothetical protein Y695_01555 [Hydrogenophaga sp. T4]
MVPNIDFSPAAMVLAMPSAVAVSSASSCSKRAQAAAAPSVPSVAVVWKPLEYCASPHTNPNWHMVS